MLYVAFQNIMLSVSEELRNVLEDAEKHLHPVRNIYLLRLRSVKSDEMEKKPKHKDHLVELVRVMENIQATYEYYGYQDYRHAALCVNIGNLRWISAQHNSADKPRALL